MSLGLAEAAGFSCTLLNLQQVKPQPAITTQPKEDLSLSSPHPYTHTQQYHLIVYHMYTYLVNDYNVMSFNTNLKAV